MPKYEFLLDAELNTYQISDLLATHRFVGVPYTDEMIENAKLDLAYQSDPDFYQDGIDYDYGLVDRYTEASGRDGTVTVRAFDGEPTKVTEMDALIAYLQMLGTLVDFSTYEADDLNNRR